VPTLDYIRIIGIEDITYDDPEKTDITYKIEHSEEADFEESNRGDNHIPHLRMDRYRGF